MCIFRRVLMLWLALAATAAVAAPSIEAYGQLPTLGDVALSPDGTRYAAIVGSAEASEIQVREVTSGTLLLASPARAYKLRSIQWADNDRIVLTVSQTKPVNSTDYDFFGRNELSQLLMHDLGTHKWQTLLDNIKLTANFVGGAPRVRTVEGRRQMIVEGYNVEGSSFKSTLFRIDPATGRAIAFEIGIAETVDWTVGTDGQPVARADYDRKTRIWKLMLRRNGVWTEVYRETAAIDVPYLRGFGRTPGTLLVASHKGGGWQDYEVTLAGAAWSAPLGESNYYIRDLDTQQPIGVLNEGLGTIAYDFWNPDDAKLWRAIGRSFTGELVQLVDWSDDRNTVMLEVFGAKSGDAVYVVDRKARAAGLLSPRYAGVMPGDIATVQTLTYKAGDGTAIPAYLTLPPGREAKGLPLVALPHGGPGAHDSPGFDWWAQALAARGYAVLQPQFRGSTGFGDAHHHAGYGQWGRKMQTDVSDGVKHLAGLGTIDPKRVCIVGGSYGGYAAMAGVTVEQGVYRCASAIAGVSDLRRMLKREKRDAGTAESPVVRFWQRYMGARDNADTSIDAFSPARLAGRVTAPLQLIHGKDDLVVPIEQSNLMASAMKDAGKPVEMVVLPSEDHWLSRPATRIAMLKALVGFLEKYNPPGPPESAVSNVGPAPD